MAELLRSGVKRWGERALLIHDGVTQTWTEVDRKSADLAKSLLALGITKGSRVGLLMPNSADWIVAFLAAARIGALVSPISTFLQAPELSRALAHADVQILMCVDQFQGHDYLARLDGLPGMDSATDRELYLPQHPFLRRILVWGKGKRSWAIGAPAMSEALLSCRSGITDRLLEAAENSVEPADPLLTIWTSGTTSLPKGVVHTHGGVLRFVHALRQIGRADVLPAERAYAAMPFFWLGGLNTILFPSLIGGGVIVTTGELAADAVLDTIVEQKVTRVAGWMGPVVELAETAAARGIDVSGVRGLGPPTRQDGTPIPPDLRGNALGMTETFGPHSAEPAGAELPAAKRGAMGRAVPGCERQIVDPATGIELPRGEIGELRVRSLGMMRGYYKREHSDCFDADGFLRTGDRCSIDEDGFLFFHGRQTELIKTSGANVSPREVEVALESNPEIAEAIVFGVPDAARGEEVVAAIVPAAGCAVDEAVLRSRLKTQLSHYKVPRRIRVVDPAAVPRTDSGKPRKAELREALFD
ncbi:hypothetical protein BRW65_01645 [Mycobacterium paraffinicum]|uniref:AMP-dependent synthetase n=1 Tax=Mycobacterium paraffinicum TaxID=53378 RepID=A0A1Q4I335_9MYCO|nr:hypothetical protein BRW65_01645 [Mycobacterium paraffinicum]